MKTLGIFFSIVFTLFRSATFYNPDNFVGKWELKTVISDPDSMANQRGSKPLFVEKVTDGYYRTAMGENNTLLYKMLDENTLYSNFSPKKEVTIKWLRENEIEINARVINEDTLRPTIMVWNRVE